MKTGFYAGSFDPFTIGHLDVVTKSSIMFEEVIVGIGVNPDKKRHFDVNEMKKAMEQVITRNGLTNVKVIYYEGLTGEIAQKYDTSLLIRGIRNGMDYASEENLASVNEEVFGIDTIYIRAGKMSHISSSMVRELMKYGKDVSKYLPKEVYELVTR